MEQDKQIILEALQSNNVFIREATNEDLAQIIPLAVQLEIALEAERGKAFSLEELLALEKKLTESYQQRLTNNTPGFRFITFVVEKGVTNENDSNDQQSTINNQIIGYIFGKVPNPKPKGDFYALVQGVYVQPTFRGQGIGNTLMRTFQEAATEYGAISVQGEVNKGGMGEEVYSGKLMEPIRDVLDEGRIRLESKLKQDQKQP